MDTIHRFPVVVWLSLVLLTGISGACSSSRNSAKSPSPAQSSPAVVPVQGTRWAVATQGEYATRAADKILAQGGNLVDAFVAASFVQAVERPQSTGLGGGGFAIVRQAETGRSLAFDFRETAPDRARIQQFQNASGQWDATLSQEGILAAGTPGFVPGMIQIHRLYGKLPWRRVLEPSIEVAEGFSIGGELASELNENRQRLSAFDSTRAIFVRSESEPWKPGDRLEQKDLAQTLRALGEGGLSAWNTKIFGPGLQSISRQLGGTLRESDLRRYQVRIRVPIRTELSDKRRIVSMPPPSSGGVHVAQVLRGLEQMGRLGATELKVEDWHALAFLLQNAFADRAEYMGDPDFVKVPVEKLLSQESIQARVNSFDPNRAKSQSEVLPSSVDTPASEPSHTVHMSLLDADGNAISSTQTINGSFGSALVVPGTGVLLNNQMDDFALGGMNQGNLFGAVGGRANALKPRKRPLSSMTPSLIESSGNVQAVLGSPSGTRIISCVASSAWHLLRGLKPEQVQQSVRIHHQWSPDELRVETLAPWTLALQAKGYRVVEKDLGCRVPMVGRFADGTLWAIRDPRGDGDAIAK